MDFPDFGDTDSFRQIAHVCTEGINNGLSPLDACYNTIRPIGAGLYYSLGGWVGLDSIEWKYFYLLLNIFWIYVVSLGTIYAFRSNSRKTKDVILPGIYVIPVLVILSYAGHVPVPLTDLPGIGIFMAGFILWLYVKNNVSDYLGFFVFGLFVALATYIKQNYIALGAFIFVAYFFVDIARNWNTVNLKANAYRNAYRGLFCVAGVSIVLFQVYAVYINSGDIWLYEKSAMQYYATSRPVYELVAYSLPFESAYLARLEQDVSLFTYFCLKMYKGLFQFTVPIYMGGYDSASAPVSTLSNSKFVKIYIAVLFYFVVNIFVIMKTYKNDISILLISGVLFSVFTALWSHVEVRYYSFPRIMMFIAILIFVGSIFKSVRERLNAL